MSRPYPPVRFQGVPAGASIQDVRQAVYARDRVCLLAPPANMQWADIQRRQAGAGSCFGQPRTVHHLRKASRGGLYTLSNLVVLCTRHNDWVEDYPLVAHTWGLVIREGEVPQQAWARMHLAGLCDYWWDGSPAATGWPGELDQ